MIVIKKKATKLFSLIRRSFCSIPIFVIILFSWQYRHLVSFYEDLPYFDDFFEISVNDDAVTIKNTTTVAICSIQKDSVPYIDEWVDYHLHAIGFDHIFIYDNSDNFGLKTWFENRAKRRKLEQNRTEEFYGNLVPFYNNFFTHQKDSISSLGVTIQHVKGGAQQMAVYQQCAQRIHKANQDANKHQKWFGLPFKNKIDWVLFLDLDEFVVLRKHDNIGKLMDDIQGKCNTKQFKYLKGWNPKTDQEVNLMSGVALNWLVFDFNEQIEYHNSPVTKRFTRRGEKINPQVKTISMVHRIDINQKPKTAHNAIYRPFPGSSKENDNKMNQNQNNHAKYSYKTVDTNCRPVPHDKNPAEDAQTAVAFIHHYYTKSIEEYKTRCGRGNVFRTFTPEEWQKKIFCWNSSTTIIDHFRKSVSNMTIDDTAWELLYNKVPKYRNYNNLHTTSSFPT